MSNTPDIISISRHRINIDGPGVTTLVAFRECPLSCKYCINEVCHYSKEKLLSKNILVRQLSATELYDILKIDNLYFMATGGGITFGGGEPGIYSDFIEDFKSICPKNWKINIETSLNIPTANLVKLIEIIDLFIIDIKDMSPEIYKKYTGIDNHLVYNNLKLLQSYEKKVYTKIRIPHIPDYNTPCNVYDSQVCLNRMGFTNIEIFDYVKPGTLA